MVQYKKPGQTICANNEIDWRGPAVPYYAVVRDGVCYDLNDFYTAPTTAFGIFVRSPWEAGVNVIAFLAFFYSVVAGNVRSDWVVIFKLIHLFFHIFVHTLPQMVHPEYDELKEEFKERATFQLICGVAFGLARYIVLLTYIYRFNASLGLVMIAAFAGLTTLRVFGENIKHFTSYAIITYAYIQQQQDEIQTPVYYALIIGFLFQMIGSVGHWLDGFVFGWTGKVWDRHRRDDRKMIPYHLFGDTGNALFLIFADVRG